MKQTKEIRNALESLIYETYDKLFDTYQSFATESEKEDAPSCLQRMKEWLCDNGNDDSENVYTEKSEELKKLVDPNRIDSEKMKPDLKQQEIS